MIFDTSIHDNEIVEEGVLTVLGVSMAILGLGFFTAATLGRDTDKNGKYRDKIIKKWNERYKANVIDGKYNQPLRYIEEISHCGYTVEDIKKLAKNAEVKENHSAIIKSQISDFDEDIMWVDEEGNNIHAKDAEKLKRDFKTKFADKVTVILNRSPFIIGWTGSGILAYDIRSLSAGKLIISKVVSFAKLQADSAKVCKETVR